jgi:flavin-dependent dehydrogenase
VSIQTDVIIVGAGPAGIAAAIAASAKGLRTLVVDAQRPPIDKPCGEGLLPHGEAALRELGIHLNSDVAAPFFGIRFADKDSSVCAKFSGGVGFALRRIRLHQLLLERATHVGVSFLWGTHVTNIDTDHVTAGGNRIRYQWLVGADGRNSQVRKWAKLDSTSFAKKRFAFRRHYQVRPWTDLVEFYWGDGCQMVMTPTGEMEACVTFFSRNSRFRLDQAMQFFPALAARLEDATPTTNELGAVTSLTRFPEVVRGRAALVGDASGTVDAIAGHGLSLSFQQALDLAEAFEQGNLEHYQSAHRKISAMPITMARLMLLMEGNDWLRRRTLRLFQNKPELFSRLLSLHAGEAPLSSVGKGEIIDFGWKFLWA